MTPQPPYCPNGPHGPQFPALWKDTSLTGPNTPERWRWFCNGCGTYWEPTPEQKARFT
ncbi:hypothetical protein [Streptomyces sp. NPDC086023]|uniref:hypothetical protein n=1 Tax=Streptomyces sp. NPDC086023 TaxID=3365746 RepID=UPI0037CD0526